jgi:7,8-didemethyl-8-hydroxy-5-deazariboflavin synthase CofG subunit
VIQPDPSLAVEVLEGVRPSQPVFEEATRLRDEGKGRVVTYSRKVFIPLTTLCRDRCSYCTFAKPPGDGGMYLEPEEALAVARAGEERQCTEALLTLGDRPEHRWPEARRFLASHGCRSTLDYVGQISELINRETALFPHANPGVMGDEAIGRLRSSNVSMGLMLENVSLRLMEPGMPHHGCPDKHPALRVSTIEAAGRRRVPFTTGLLVGIGENAREIVDSLVALGELQARWRCIQEVIIQNFRAKDDTRMRWHAEPVPLWFARVVAVARWLLGPEVNLQVPPNLTQRYEIFLAAGINDWGGVSPLTIDWVNPEQPWPHLEDLRHRTEAAGYRLKPRLPVYPEFITPEWIEPHLMDKVRRAVDEQGYARAPQMEVSVG